jgi:hypothetical protein
VPLLTSRGAWELAAFDEVVQRALAKQPEDRYRHASEFKAALEAVSLGGGASGTRPTARTDLASATARPEATNLGATRRASFDEHPAPPERSRRSSGAIVPLLIGPLLILLVLLAIGIGYLLANGRITAATEPTIQPVATTVAQAPTPLPPTPVPSIPTTPPTPVRQLTAAPAAQVAPTAVAPTPPPRIEAPTQPTAVRARVIRRYGAAIRTSPSSDAEILAMVACNQVLNVLESQGGWRRVSNGSVVGWVGDARIAAGADPGPVDCRGAITFPVGARAVASVPSGCLSLRGDPSRRASFEHCVPTGHGLQIINGPREVDGEDWFEVRSPSSGSGWALAEFLRPAG